MTEQQKYYNFNVSRLKSTPKGERYHDPFCLDFEGKIDEMIYPTIETLNQKGYYTSYSCSGHYKSNEKIHIMFDPEVKAEHFSTIPAGFEIETIQHGEMRELTQEEIAAGYTMQLDTVFSVFISKQITAGNEYQRFRETLLANAALLQWATELPNRRTTQESARPVDPYEAFEGYLKRYRSAEEEVLAVLDNLEGRAAQRLKKYLEKRKAEDLDEYESIIGAIYLKKTDDPGTLAQSIINAANILKEWGEL